MKIPVVDPKHSVKFLSLLLTVIPLAQLQTKSFTIMSDHKSQKNSHIKILFTKDKALHACTYIVHVQRNSEKRIVTVPKKDIFIVTYILGVAIRIRIRIRNPIPTQ